MTLLSAKPKERIKPFMKKYIKILVDENRVCPWCMYDSCTVKVFTSSVRVACNRHDQKKPCGYYAWIPRHWLTPIEVYRYYR